MKLLTGEWVIDKTNAKQRRIIHYWLTIVWLTAGLALWVVLREALWFVGFMSLYAIWVTHLAGWAAETPVESQAETLDLDLQVEESLQVGQLSEGARRGLNDAPSAGFTRGLRPDDAAIALEGNTEV